MTPSRRRIDRAALATGLDLLVLTCAAAALVLALGAGDRFRVLGIVISLKDPIRPFAAAVALTALRLALTRLPPFPVFRSRTPGAAFVVERERLARPARAGRAVRYYAAAAVLGSLVWLTPHILHIRRVPDVGDPVFSAWRLALMARQLTGDPLHLFDGNIFYPARYTLTYSDSTFLQAVAAAPFLTAGADPLVVSNIVFLSAFPLCAFAFFYVVWRLTSDPRAGLVAGLLGGLWPFHWEHYSHLELQFFCFVPLAFLAALRMIASPSWRTGLALGALVALQWLAAMYFGVMLLVFLAPVVAAAAAAWGIRPYRQSATAFATAAAIIAVAFGLLALPYIRSQDARGDRPLRTVREYSATAVDYGRAHHRLASYQWISRVDNKPERELFTGLSPLALAAVGMVPPLGIAGIGAMAASAVAFDGSLGLNGLTYDELYTYAAPFRGMRVPARFAIFVGSGLILLAGLGCGRLFARMRGKRSRAAILAALVAVVMLDLRPTLVLLDYPETIPSIYEAVTPDMVLAEFPMSGDATIAHMYFSTSHRARLVNGHSGYIPDSYVALRESLERFPVDGTLDTLRAAGATHATVNCTLWANPARCEGVLAWLEKLEAEGRVRLVKADLWEKRPVRLYEIR